MKRILILLTSLLFGCGQGSTESDVSSESTSVPISSASTSDSSSDSSSTIVSDVSSESTSVPISSASTSDSSSDSSSTIVNFALSNTSARLCDNVSLRICVSGYVENLSNSTKSAKIKVSIPSTKSGWPSVNHGFSKSVKAGSKVQFTDILFVTHRYFDLRPSKKTWSFSVNWNNDPYPACKWSGALAKRLTSVAWSSSRWLGRFYKRSTNEHPHGVDSKNFTVLVLWRYWR